MLETIREYALERLAESGDECAARRCHLDWCAALAEVAELLLEGPEQVPVAGQARARARQPAVAHRWALSVGKLHFAHPMRSSNSRTRTSNL